MLRKDAGVILRSARSGETSRIATFLGKDSGKIKLIGKGALAPKSPFHGLLEPGNVASVVFYYKEGRTLFFLKEAHVSSTLGPVRDSLSHLASALAMLELLEAVCYWGSPEARAVDLVAEWIAGPRARDPVHSYLTFAFKLLEILGEVPDLSACAACGGPVAGGFYHPVEGTSACRTHDKDSPHRVGLDGLLLAYIASAARSTAADASKVEADRSQRNRFGRILHWTYTFHVQGYSLPKALKLLPKDT